LEVLLKQRIFHAVLDAEISRRNPVQIIAAKANFDLSRRVTAFPPERALGAVR
jgi:hypothetical protein